MKKLFTKDIYFPLISGILFIPGWYEWGSGLILLFAFIPLLIISETNLKAGKSGRRIFVFGFLAFIIWNIGDTWWIRNAMVDNKPSYTGVSAAVLITTILMSLAFWLAYQVRKNYGRLAWFVGIVAFWLAYEFSYTHGEISWPWLTLGNGFAYNIRLIQWYEYTGVFGGSLWILISNVLIYIAFFNEEGKLKFTLKNSIIAFSWIGIPLFISLLIFARYKEVVNPVNIVVVQPNIDPYLKFNDIPSLEQTKIQIDLGESLTDSATDYIVAPETSIMNNIWIGLFNKVPDFEMVKEVCNTYPGLKYVTGIMCYKLYKPGEPHSKTAYEINNGYFRESYNSAIQIDTSDNIPVYHKSKLVVGVEKMPYPGLLKILKPITMKLGGTFRSHSTQKEREAFLSSGDSLKVGVPICYESVYGEFVTEFVAKGANLIFVITNDGWWGNTPGHRQHNSLSSIRAIETRRSIARSANTGISSFINQKGEVIQKLGWWERGAIKDTLNANDKITFYTKYGDYIGRIGSLTALLMILSLLVRWIKARYGLHVK